ncbi:hypothetical protein RJ640_005590 [Escallonia rubra]|uniref:Uncharacterized protein n=1 Tax=Escallonia rubra TaxID=112253 RepID=A0AA88UAH7_9ASTE|nr:hypothetical protein RJ640_005590 [Escallonia rubra]
MEPSHWVNQADNWKDSDTFVRYTTFLVDRHDFVNLKQSAVVIQHAIRAWILMRRHTGTTLAEEMSTGELINAAIMIQMCIRGRTTRSTYSHRDYHVEKASIGHAGNEVNDLQEKAASKIQLAWKQIVICKSLRFQHSAATKIRSSCRGYLARKDLRGQLLDLRLRVQKSATNVDDGMRIMNRLVAALSELLMNMEIRLAVYPHLTEVLIDSRASVQTILLEFLRCVKDFFIASELLEKNCLNQRCAIAVRCSPALLKRLHSDVEDLTKKATKEKRNARSLANWELRERRLRKAVKLLDLITNAKANCNCKFLCSVATVLSL